MKRIISYVTVVLLLLSALLSTSCGSLVVLSKSDDGMLVNKSKGLEYTYAPTYIEPVSVGDEYAVYKRSGMTLYEIPGLDPTQWLCEEYTGSSMVFYSPDIEIPTLEEFAPVTVYICVSDEITIAVATVDDAETIAAVVDAYMNGEEVTYPLVDSIAYYQLKFASDTYKGIYYNLTYAVFDEGYFIYDRSTKRCVAADGLLETFIEGGAADSAS